MESGYLPFLPTSPSFHCPPFHVLFNRPINVGPRRRMRIQMDSNDVLNWNRLEHTLTQLFRSFQSAYSIPPMPPIVRTSLVCQDQFDYPSQFATAEKRCRNWFSVWMAMVSLGIAIAEISDGHPGAETAPKWFVEFSKHMDESTLSGIRQQLGHFNGSLYRAGVFLDLCSPQEQPTVDFFVHLNIPIWYRWGSKETSRLQNNPSYWGKYIPPAHLLQKAQSFLIVAPPPPQPADTGTDRPWTAFFAERKMRATGLPKKKPPLKVFHWERDFVSGAWNRVPIIQDFASETLAAYGKMQKHYDACSNEWDCCTEMGDKDAEELQADEWANSDNEPFLPIGVPPSIASPDTSMANESAPEPHSVSLLITASSSSANAGLSDQPQAATHTERTEGYHPDVNSPADVLRLFYGFVAPPSSVRVIVPPTTDLQIKDLALGIGCSSMEEIQDYAKTAVGKCATHFFWAMSQTPWVPPPNAIFDLATGNPKSLKYSRRLKFLHQLPGNTFLFDFQGGSTVDWRICVADVTLALFIIRLDDDLSDYDIARALLDQGSPFRTLLQVPSFVVEAPPIGIPRIRLSSYIFRSSDYEMYCLERADLFRSQRVSRQALMRGGILWRLAMESASFQGALSGPTTVATLQRMCSSLHVDSPKMWIDDVLDKHEIDIISGVYHVYTGETIRLLLSSYVLTNTSISGQGQQTSIRSWWPPADLWDTLVRQQSWSRRSEQWYTSRLEELASGRGVPLTNTQWRSRIKVNSSVRRAIANNQNISIAFLKDNGILH